MEHGGSGQRCGKPDPDPTVADTTGGESDRRERGELEEEKSKRGCINAPTKSGGEDVADTEINGCVEGNAYTGRRKKGTGERQEQGLGNDDEAVGDYCSSRSGRDYWEVEPPVGRLVDGLPNRVSQLRALGNSIVPQIAEEIGYAIRTAETG